MLRMKSLLNAAVFSLALAGGLLATTATANAQDGRMTVQVPFAFSAGSHSLPSGQYSVQQVSEHTLLLRAINQKRAQFLIANPESAANTQTRGKLIFHRVGNQHYLEQIWFQGSSLGENCPTSRAEKEALVAESMNPNPGEEVALYAEPSR